MADADNADIVDRLWAVADRLYDRLGTKSARGLDLDAAVVASKAAEEIERLRSLPHEEEAGG